MTTAATAHPDHQHIALRNDPKKVAVASMIGTAIEFYDYYIYAAAAVLIFNTQFFDKTDEKAVLPWSPPKMRQKANVLGMVLSRS